MVGKWALRWPIKPAFQCVKVGLQKEKIRWLTIQTIFHCTGHSYDLPITVVAFVMPVALVPNLATQIFVNHLIKEINRVPLPSRLYYKLWDLWSQNKRDCTCLPDERVDWHHRWRTTWMCIFIRNLLNCDMSSLGASNGWNLCLPLVGALVASEWSRGRTPFGDCLGG